MDLLVGESILSCRLLSNADPANLKNSTYDLTIGDIIPIGARGIINRRKEAPKHYFLRPREMIFVMSKEEFSLPGTVTGLATLRTSLTKSGLLALNVGIIDPFFNGPISTSLINFSDRPVEITVGEKFFRVLFVSHEDVSDQRPDVSESIKRSTYLKDMERRAYSEFPKNYLNIPEHDEDFFRRNFYSLIRYGLFCGASNFLGIPLLLFFIALLVYIFSATGFAEFYFDLYKSVKSWL